MKNGITFSYGIKITKFLARSKYGCKGYVMNLSRYSFGFYIVSSFCNLGKCMVHACGFLLWWNMSFMDRAHLGYWYVSLSLGIYIWSHYICCWGYDYGHIGIYMVWFLYMSFSCDGHSSHGLGSILLSWNVWSLYMFLCFYLCILDGDIGIDVGAQFMMIMA